jgi:Ca2+-dependent lipid-binding protein
MTHNVAGAVKLTGKILLEIVSASDLLPVDGGSADPYVKLTGANGLVIAAPFEKFKTAIICRNVNPQFQQSFELPVGSLTGTLIFSVIDHNEFTRNKPIGSVNVELASIISGSFNGQRELQLVTEAGGRAGTLLIRAQWHPAERNDVDPMEEVATFERGTYQFKTFTSAAARNIRDDINAANRACRDWLNAVRHRIDLIKVDNESDPGTAYVTAWFRVRE